MLTEGVEDASTAMYENVEFSLKKGTLSQFRAAGQGFQNTLSDSLYFIYVELIQKEKTALYCAMFCYITKCVA